jgi:hypothetical protein
VTKNVASQMGGGVCYEVYSQDPSEMDVNQSTIEGNSSWAGGGIADLACKVTIENSAICDNTASHEGGGICNGDGGSEHQTTVARNVTVSGNNAQDGGGVFTHDGWLHMSDVTVSSNTASELAGGLDGPGSTVQMANTIIAGNTVKSAPDDISMWGILYATHNLLGVGDLTGL